MDKWLLKLQNINHLHYGHITLCLGVGTLNINEGVNIEDYTKLRSFLKRRSEGFRRGFRPKKAYTFSSEEINKFLIEACDEKYLAMKVTMIMGIMGACRANEMYDMKTEDIKDLGSAFLVNVPNTKTKVSRKFTITDNFYPICQKYMDIRPVL
ncbi:hypothetical protein NQ315_014479 [Exocentrus adspersus]|uniref:Tyr recombinase domain-containing protein n=1 Tax=Exocentrus adspersus TaxID=1586481 RepID=A0AAV8VE34_9CUCU|nr:hypothetical protein NQ315_014479 [Exocentrus adspersus]